jgi:hypothetical protein
MLNDSVFNQLDADRRIDDSKNAGRFAGSGAHSSCKLRKVVSAVQGADRILPAIAINHVIPVRNKII